MDDIENLSRKKLKKLIKDTQETLHELTDELERRELANQNKEIDNLDNHIESVELNLSRIKELFTNLLKEHKQ